MAVDYKLAAQARGRGDAFLGWLSNCNIFSPPGVSFPLTCFSHFGPSFPGRSIGENQEIWVQTQAPLYEEAGQVVPRALRPILMDYFLETACKNQGPKGVAR